MTRTSTVRVTGLRGVSLALFAGELIRAHGEGPVLVLGSSAKRIDSLIADLRSVLGETADAGRVQAFPRHDTLPYDRFSPQRFVISERVGVLQHWLEQSKGIGAGRIVVSDWMALSLKVPSRGELAARSLQLRVGENQDRDVVVSTLANAGYARMPLVEERGEFAVRGGIVDFFPPHVSQPIRIEFFGDVVDSIRKFDATNQRSLSRIETAIASAPRELLLNRDQVVAQADAIRALGRECGTPEKEVDRWLDGLLRGAPPPGVEALAQLLQPILENPIEYLPDNTLVIIDDPAAGQERLKRYHEEATESFRAARRANRLVETPDALLVSPDILLRELTERRAVYLERLDILDLESETERILVETQTLDTLRSQLAATRTHDRALAPLADQLTEWLRQNWRCVIAVTALSAAERLKDLLSQYGVSANVATAPRPSWFWSKPGRVEIRVAPLSEGVSIPDQKLALLTEEEIFGKRQKSRQASGWKEGVAVEGISQLKPGDPLVHRDHGIGRYRGLDSIFAGKIESELLSIEYAGGDKLFLPIHRLNLIHRYGAFDGAGPKLDRLGGETWQKSQAKVKKSLRNMAKGLLSMHAARELAPGFAFSARDSFFEEFEAAFGFEETSDQATAIEDVLADMQKPRSMDRIVCGDVGYGKTEVAIRAAFRAAMDGKQVAVLTPTTILCEQHYQTFLSRFAGYPIEVEMLSRFRSPKEAREVIAGLAEGLIDIVIGTHRLLNKKVEFRDLGLLVVDEEQRFGVAHKERIKNLRRTVDVLTLTATPIPRTLQMAFSGLRDLSVIDTAPVDRLAIRTQIGLSSDSLIREAILREIQRGGQVFFVHNRVATIGAVFEMLKEIVPEASAIVAHGQMSTEQLENRMRSFVRGEAEILLCTTIIENGLDIPRANTILIDRADHLGLAQLYQLRGRVGRSRRRAYAYLLIPAAVRHLPTDAQRRLEAIGDLTELGSGFRLASMDLEIRGAGDLLGSEQSGNLRAVGYETYMELLEETIDELRGQIHEEMLDPEIQLPVVARLPEVYVPDVGQRLALYKRLSGARDNQEVAQIRDEILDRYGVMPKEGENLLALIQLKILARRLGLSALKLKRGEFVLEVAKQSRIDPKKLLHLLNQPKSGVRLTPDHRIIAAATGAQGESSALFASANALLKKLLAA